MRFGLIGAGCIGELRARALKQVPGSELIAISDVDENRARALASSSHAQIYSDYQQLLKQDSVDAVIVSTPPQFHEEQVLAAFSAGKQVLCEKPLTNSLQSSRHLVEAAAETGRTLATGFNHRYFPAIQFVKQTLDSGLIGRLDHVRAFAGHQGLSQFRSAWEYDKSVIGGGALLDVGIHIIDLTRYLLGEVEEVYGVATDKVWKLNGSEDNAMAILRSPDGKHATLQATWAEWKGYRFHIEAYGERGMARAYYAPMWSMRIVLNEPGGKGKRQFRFYPGVNLGEKLHSWKKTVEDTFAREIGDFVRLCGGEAGTIADGFSGFRAIEIANAVYESTRNRQPVKLIKAMAPVGELK